MSSYPDDDKGVVQANVVQVGQNAPLVDNQEVVQAEVVQATAVQTAPIQATIVGIPTEGQPAIAPQPIFGDFPMQCTCPSCNKVITTNVVARISTNTHLSCLMWCAACTFMCPCACCCCAVYAISAFKDKDHFCPECKACLGTKTVFGSRRPD
mmetsp:Transcript_59875/g.110882  ORF Transcript_59875/g.110882 Transcript_59875/m.110882 type:complete len:153 (-) Transcript_59875:94-552(-)